MRELQIIERLDIFLKTAEIGNEGVPENG